MNIFGLLPYIFAAVIIIFNKQLLDYLEKKSIREGKRFDRQRAFMITIIGAIILILKGLFFSRK